MSDASSFSLNTLLTNVIPFLASAGVKLVLAIVITIVGFIIINKLVKYLRNHKLKNTEKSVSDFVISFINLGLKILVVLTAVCYLGVPMTNLAAVLASCGLAVGLALQGSLSNLAGGIMILIFKPFKDGDFISVNGFDGTVSEITILYTYLVTPDKKTVIIPNSQASSAAVTNYSMEKYRRVDVSIGVSYKSDVNRVREILLELAKAQPYAETEPAPAVVISSYGDSAINFTIRVWTENAHYWDVAGSLNYALQKTLADNGIEIPYPQLDIHLDK